MAIGVPLLIAAALVVVGCDVDVADPNRGRSGRQQGARAQLTNEEVAQHCLESCTGVAERCLERLNKLRSSFVCQRTPQGAIVLNEFCPDGRLPAPREEMLRALQETAEAKTAACYGAEVDCTTQCQLAAKGEQAWQRQR